MNKLHSAIDYAKNGFSVLPIHGKQPVIAFKDQPPLTVDEVRDYWTSDPDLNIAVKTTTFFVVDVDTAEAHGRDGIKSMQQLPKGTINDTLTQRTASGGYQLFYVKPTHSHMQQIIGWRPGVDIKANSNNYVLVPPSTTSKGTYQWIDAEISMQLPSDQLWRLINKRTSAWTEQQGHAVTNKRWTGKVLDNIVAGVGQGQRNDHLTRLCGQIIHAGAEKDTVLELMHFANQFNSPPLNDAEVNHIVESILREEISKWKNRQH